MPDRSEADRVDAGASVTAVDVEARGAIEAVVLAATEPVPPALLAQLVELPTARVEELCDELAAEYEREGRGFQLARVAGGYRFQTHPDAYAYVERFVLEGQVARLSGPALETLAIVAYKQPIARAQISAIRGVNVDATLKTLVARGYIEESGHETRRATRRCSPRRVRSSSGSASTRSPTCPPLADFVPESSLVEALERGLRGVDVDLEVEPTTRARPPSRSRARSGRVDEPAAEQSRAEGERLQKVLARAGLGSRRACEALIAAGRVTVDGEVAVLGARVDPAHDRIVVDGVPVVVDETRVYWLLNKPAGYVTTARDPQGRPTVIELVPSEPRSFAVGRLDRDTEGLLILTNDGELAELLTHPRHGVEKAYLAEVEGVPSAGRVARAARRRRARRRPGARRARAGRADGHATAAARSRSCSRKGANASCVACAPRSDIRCGGSCARASARSPIRSSRPVRTGR